MPDPTSDPVSGDGVNTIPDQERDEMSQVDLSPNVANQLLTESVGNIQSSNQRSRDTAGVAFGVLQGAMSRNFDELGTVESRANSGVIATPVAGPTTQG